MIDAPKALAAALISIIAMSAKYHVSRNPVMRGGKYNAKGPACRQQDRSHGGRMPNR